MSAQSFRVVDCDGHILEPLDIWDRFLEARYREDAKNACSVHNYPEGGASVRVNGELKPKGMQGGGTYGMPRAKQATARWVPGELADGGFDAHARLRDQMDPGNIEAAIIFGSLGNVLNGVRDPDLLAVMCRGYNDWVSEEYCAPYRKRLYPMACLPWQNIPEAIREVERIARMGFKGIKVPAKRRLGDLPPYHPDMEPIWTAAEEAGLVLAVHPSVYYDGLPEMADILVKEEPDLPGLGGICAPLNGMVSLAHFIYGGILERHASLKLAVIECNGGWLPLLLDRLDRQYKHTPQRFPAIKMTPSDYFKRQCAVAFMAEESTLPMYAPYYQDQIIWGSDFPHFDAESADDIQGALAGIDPGVRRKILRDNAIRFFGLPLQ